MVSAATEAAVMASISTPVRPSTDASASTSTPPSTTSARTSTWSSPSGWQSGISVPVCLAAWMPAMRATPRTSPLGASPAETAAAVSGLIDTNARETACRRVISFDDTSTIRAAPESSRWVRSGDNALSCLDELAHAAHVAVAQQLDGVGLAVDDALEERLALLVGGQGALRPAAHVVEHDRQLRVLLAEQLGHLRLHALGQRRRRAGSGDRDRQRARADDRREDEVAQRRHVHDVDEHRAALGVLVDADVDVGVVGAGNHHEGALEVRRHVLALLPADRALERELGQLGPRLRRHQRHVAIAGEQPLDLLQADLAAADDQALAIAQLEARDVEGRVEHVAHAGLVADPAAELADAFLPGIGCCRHGDYRVEIAHGPACPRAAARRSHEAAPLASRRRVRLARGPAALPARALRAHGAPRCGALAAVPRALRRHRPERGDRAERPADGVEGHAGRAL